MKIKRLFFVVWMFLLCCFGYTKVYAAETVRVGFPIQSGFTEKDAQGNYIGYTVDYLEEISKYTGWDYEYVEAEGDLNQQLTTLLDMLEKGKIDLMGVISHNEALEEIYSYPSYNYGMAYTSIAVLYDDARWHRENPDSWEGIRIATYPRLKTRVEQLEKFASVTGFTYDLVEYESWQEVDEAVRNGEADATLAINSALPDGFKSIADFSPNPFYFATTKGNQNVVRGLNLALSNIEETNPYLKSQLNSKYFEGKSLFSVSEEDKEYIESLGTIKVLMIDGNAPLHWIDSEGNPKGISISYLQEFARVTGLKYEVVPVISYEEAIEELNKGDITLFIGLDRGSELQKDLELILSAAYLDSNRILVFNKNASEDITAGKFVYNSYKGLEKVEDSVHEAYYIESYCIKYYLQKEKLYSEIDTNTNDAMYTAYTFGLADKEQIHLLSMMNEFLAQIDTETERKFLYNNMITEAGYTLGELLQIYSLEISVFIFIVVIIIIVLIIRYVKIKTRMFREKEVQENRFHEMAKLMDECFFEYNYNRDYMNIQNNRVVLQGKHKIEKFLLECEDYPILNDLLKLKQDTQHDVVLETQEGPKWYRIIIKIVRNDKGEPSYAFGKIYSIHKDMAERKALKEKSEKDGLTGLLNRLGGELHIKRALCTNPNQGILLLFDIDNFKSVNDYMGHPIGDRLLIDFAEFIKDFFREEDVKCRMGGDEFLVLINNSISQESLSEKLKVFNTKVNEQVMSTYKEYNVTVSIGAAYVTEKANTYKALYEKADRAMYMTKRDGKNGFYISDEP